MEPHLHNSFNILISRGSSVIIFKCRKVRFSQCCPNTIYAILHEGMNSMAWKKWNWFLKMNLGSVLIIYTPLK